MSTVDRLPEHRAVYVTVVSEHISSRKDVGAVCPPGTLLYGPLYPFPVSSRRKKRKRGQDQAFATVLPYCLIPGHFRCTRCGSVVRVTGQSGTGMVTTVGHNANCAFPDAAEHPTFYLEPDDGAGAPEGGDREDEEADEDDADDQNPIGEEEDAGGGVAPVTAVCATASDTLSLFGVWAHATEDYDTHAAVVIEGVCDVLVPAHIGVQIGDFLWARRGIVNKLHDGILLGRAIGPPRARPRNQELVPVLLQIKPTPAATDEDPSAEAFVDHMLQIAEIDAEATINNVKDRLMPYVSSIESWTIPDREVISAVRIGEGDVKTVLQMLLESCGEDEPNASMIAHNALDLHPSTATTDEKLNMMARLPLAWTDTEHMTIETIGTANAYRLACIAMEAVLIEHA